MDNKLIENLQAERSILVRRVAKIDDLLSAYGVYLKSSENKLSEPVRDDGAATANEMLDGVSLSDLSAQTIPIKVLYALRQLQKGSAQDVADKLINLIPTYDRTRAFQDCRHWLSRHNVQGIVNSKKIGNKNIYSWKS